MGIKSNGRTTEVDTDGVSIKYQDGQYDASTPLAKVTHSGNGIRQSGTSRNVEISGNSQECYAGRGITSEYNIKIVGSSEMFTGKDQRAADNCLNDVKGVILQSGDNRNDMAQALLEMIDCKSATSAMTTSLSNDINIKIPQLTRIQDLPDYSMNLFAYLENYSLTNSAYQAMCAAKLEVERQLLQKWETLKCMGKKFGEGDFESLLAGEIGLPSAEDIQGKEYNITRSRLYENYIPNLPALLAAEKNIC